MKATSSAEPRNEEQERPQPDPLLMRQQQLTQQLQQTNQRIMDLRQQKTLAEDMITDATMTAAEIRGRLAEIALQQQTQANEANEAEQKG